MYNAQKCTCRVFGRNLMLNYFIYKKMKCVIAEKKYIPGMLLLAYRVAALG